MTDEQLDRIISRTIARIIPNNRRRHGVMPHNHPEWVLRHYTGVLVDAAIAKLDAGTYA